MSRMEELQTALKWMDDVNYIETIGDRHVLVAYYDGTRMLMKVEEIA